MHVLYMRSFYLFSPLLEGGQFHAYLTAQAQTVLLLEFLFLNIPTLRGLERTL